jgi:hypothetical protein
MLNEQSGLGIRVQVTESMQAQGESILDAAVGLAQQIWHDRLMATYALGSLAHGGFSALSDIDLGLVLEDPLVASDGDQVVQLTDSIKATNKPFAERLSVFWGSVDSLSGAASGGRFPPLDRLDLQKYGRLLAGTDVRRELPAPTHRDLVLAGAEFALRRLATEETIRKLKNPEALAASDLKTLTRLILFPVRFMFTARTGDVGRNDAAVGHFLAAKSDPASALASLALEWRNSGQAPSDASAIRAIAAGVLPLYDEFLLDHEPRLRKYGRPDLAESFGRWRKRLQDDWNDHA